MVDHSRKMGEERSKHCIYDPKRYEQMETLEQIQGPQEHTKLLPRTQVVS